MINYQLIGSSFSWQVFWTQEQDFKLNQVLFFLRWDKSKLVSMDVNHYHEFQKKKKNNHNHFVCGNFLSKFSNLLKIKFNVFQNFKYITRLMDLSP